MSPGDSRCLVVVGAGQTSGELVVALRQEGYAGGIVVLGDEPHLPYQRPPLSKGYLAGELPVDALYLRPRSAYDKARAEVHLNARVEYIDRARKVVTLQDGRAFAYDMLALNTGGRPRRLTVSGADRAEAAGNFHYIRTIEDIDRFRRSFAAGRRLVVIGGGFIGLEAGAVARKHGLQVTILESLPRVLARVTAPEVSRFYERIHREHAVDLRFEFNVEDFEFDSTGSVVAVLGRGGERIAADVIVAGIGLVPNVELAARAGLQVQNGVVVDEFARTSDPHIFAAGDCANHPSPLYARRVRLESVGNAVEQARAMAANIAGKQRPYHAVPWFWSDQYQYKLQAVGLSQGHDQVVVRGSTANSSFAVFYLSDGVLLAADLINRPQEFMVAKRLVAARMSPDPRRLADEAQALKSLIQ